ncbi:hypothetical protein M8J75_009477 [Diaphorina citri]|nr:hypothetical protein M8J75_009477 [Diaphorina citri]
MSKMHTVLATKYALLKNGVWDGSHDPSAGVPWGSHEDKLGGAPWNDGSSWGAPNQNPKPKNPGQPWLDNSGDVDPSTWGAQPPKSGPKPLSKEIIYASKQFRILCEMGFKKEDIESALRASNMNGDDALEQLSAWPGTKRFDAGSDMQFDQHQGTPFRQTPTHNFAASGSTNHQQIISCSGVSHGPSLEYMAVEIKLQFAKLLVVVLYKASRVYDLNTLDEFLADHIAQSEHIIVMGDFNVNMLNPSALLTSRLTEIVSTYGLSVLPSEPTHHGLNGTSSQIDLTLTVQTERVKLYIQLPSLARGYDGIDIRMLKLSLPHILPAVTHVFNESLTSGVFPSSWCSAEVVPLNKVVSPASCGDYRPVAILPV